MFLTSPYIDQGITGGVTPAITRIESHHQSTTMVALAAEPADENRQLLPHLAAASKH
jgi:hypothetical protein